MIGLQSVLYKILLQRYRIGIQTMFKNFFNKIIEQNPQTKGSYDKDKLQRWSKKWSVFGMKPNNDLYLFYRCNVGDNENIVPNDIARNYIEPILTPQEFQPFYNDKNSFGVFIDKSMMPRTYFRSMNGVLYDEDYRAVKGSDFDRIIKDANELIVKPSKEMGGKGISVFNKINNRFVDKDNNVLSYDYLSRTYKSNYLVQERIKQSSFMSKFNPTSVNTLRIAVYRDVTSGELIILGGFFRIGGKGALVDNITSGGASVPIDVETGRLGNYASDKTRVKHSTYNDINFETTTFEIPNWIRIVEFVKEVARRMPHMSLLANDIALDEQDNPILIEVNSTDFSYTSYQVSGTPFFKEYTDDIIRYCLEKNTKINPNIIMKYFG
ncbi:MAG: hypothetical protein E7067_02985 [Lentimicrobiaceae bacterium]|nr:hypothetical protein [Lentimicrobiaceae bacterium]